MKIFVASSSELQAERQALAGCVLRLNRWLVDQGKEERVSLEKWEYLDSSMGVDHKQEECNRMLRGCDMAVGFCLRKFGQYTERKQAPNCALHGEKGMQTMSPKTGG